MNVTHTILNKQFSDPAQIKTIEAKATNGSSPSTDINKVQNKKILLNVRGKRYEVLLRMFDRFPNSRLGKLKQLIDDENLSSESLVDICDSFDKSTNEFYFNKNPNILNSIIDYYETGKLHYDINLCCNLYLNELKYWGFNEFMFDDCCQMKFLIEKEQFELNIKEKDEIIYHLYHKEKFGTILPSVREFIWNIMDKPGHSLIRKLKKNDFIHESNTEDNNLNLTNNEEPKNLLIDVGNKFKDFITELSNTPLEYFIEKIYSVLYFLMIILTVSISIVRTIPDLGTEPSVVDQYNKIELVCMIIFTVEFLIRLIIAPRKFKFFLSILNYLEMIPVLLFYANLIAQYNQPVPMLNKFKETFKMFLLFKIFRLSKSLNMLANLFRSSYKEMILYLTYLFISVLVFSSFVYYLESEQPKTDFISIPAAFWWSIATLTTVGYGDIVPTSIYGKIIGGFCTISGIILLAMPLSLLATNFSEHYKTDKKIMRILHVHSKKRKLNDA